MGIILSRLSIFAKPDDIDNCRLTQLNWDCLEKVFEYLDTKDLIQLSEVNSIVCDAILERGIKRNAIDFDGATEIWNIQEIFAKFGKHMIQVVAHEENFHQQGDTEAAPIDNFLRLLTKHCTSNHITKMNLNFDYRKVNGKLLTAAQPFFTNIQTLCINGRSYNAGDNMFSATIINAAKQLSVLYLSKGTNIDFNLLHCESMKHLQTLVLYDIEYANADNWVRLFSNQPKLKSFAWQNLCKPNYSLCKYIAHSCGDNLEQFLDLQMGISRKCQSEEFIMNRYDYFAKFTNLKDAAITSYLDSGRDLIDALATIAQNNTVQNLCLMFLDAHKIIEDFFNFTLQPKSYAKCTSLSSLTILNIASRSNLWSDNMDQFIKCSQNLHTIAISGRCVSAAQIARIAVAAQRLKILNLSMFLFQDEFVVETPAICQLLTNLDVEWKQRNRNAEEPTVLNVYVNPEQKRHLAEYELDLSDSINIVEVLQPLTYFRTKTYRLFHWTISFSIRSVL